jgi:hypothetical protein
MLAARLLSFLVILLSLTPMASLYFLMLWMQSEPNMTTIDLETLNSVTTLMKRSNATNEELLIALFQDRMTKLHASDLYVFHTSSMLSIFLAWFISVLFVFFIPCIAFVYRCLRRQGWISGKKRRRRKLLQTLSKYRKILSEDDRVPGDSYAVESVDEECSKWIVPRPGTPVGPVGELKSLQLREVVGECAICLTSYSSGETIVWASNQKCVHCFHETCIVVWLLRRRNRPKQQCPCCRQAFLDGP